VPSKTSPNRSAILEEKLKSDTEGDTSCAGGEGDDEGVTGLEEVRLEEVLDVELASEKIRLCEEL